MLRALASYFFGGIEDESPEAPIECETREVNDWLVVNLPDHKDSVHLNDDDDAYEIDDEDVRDAMDDDEPVEVDESDINEMDMEDDILLSLSFLMPPDTEQLSTELSNNESDYQRVVLERPCLPKYGESMLASNYAYRQLMDHNRRIILANMVRESITPRDSMTARMLDFFSCLNIEAEEFYREALMNSMIPSRHHRTMRDDIVNEFERKRKVAVQVLDLTPPPVHSKNYVNHRHPEKLLNQDLLQRIKELEPEQQAVQRSVKKNLTRGQLNRQNKNYMYETSSKKNRRCNRQRNHSGANNNRKC